MTKTQIATWLNNYVMKNEIVDPATWTEPIAEDLSNFVDVGVPVLNTMSPNALLNLKNNLVATIKNETIKRVLESKTFGMVKDNATFRASIQRIMTNGLYSAKDSARTNLDPTHGSYFDGAYYGADLDAKLFTKEDTFKIVYSISDAEWKQALADAGELADLISLIEIRVENSITSKLNALVKRLYCAIIDNCEKATTPRVIKVVTEFSKKFNPNHATAPWDYEDDILSDRDMLSWFNSYVKSLIAQTQTYVQEFNQIYNDGTVEQFTPKDKISSVFISQFIDDAHYITDPIDFNLNGYPKIEKISAWQTLGKGMVKDLDTVASVTVPGATSSDDDVTYSKIIGIVYDTDGVGITTLDGGRNIGTEYVGAEMFTNYHVHLSNRFFIDSRLASIVFELS